MNDQSPSESRQQRRARERAEAKAQNNPGPNRGLATPNPLHEVSVRTPQASTAAKSTHHTVLTDLTYYIEFADAPTTATVDAIVKAVTRPSDRDVDAAVADEPDMYFLDDSTALLTISMKPHPVTQSSGTEGNLHDIADDATPDDETPAELIERLSQARRVARDHGGQLTDGNYESEVPTRLVSWDEFDAEW